MLPDLYAEDPDFYRNMRIQDLRAKGIHKLIRKHDLPGLMLRAFDTLAGDDHDATSGMAETD